MLLASYVAICNFIEIATCFFAIIYYTADEILLEDYTRRPTVTATTPSVTESDRCQLPMAATETTLPVACTALPVSSQNGEHLKTTAQGTNMSLPHGAASSKQTHCTSSTAPVSRMKRPSPSSSSSSSSSPFGSSPDSSPKNSRLLSGAQQPTPQQIKTLLESYFSDSTSSDSGNHISYSKSKSHKQINMCIAVFVYNKLYSKQIFNGRICPELGNVYFRKEIVLCAWGAKHVTLA